MIPLLEEYGLSWLGYIIVFGVLEFAGENFTLHFVAASLNTCGKLNVKAGDLILYTDLPMYASYVVLKNCPCDEWAGRY